MATRQSQKRLNKEYKSLISNPPPYIVAKPNDENILEWHYIITGPPNTPYENGQYHGILRFPHEYPFQPPAISMLTPNGRFKPNTRLCLSMSDYHPDLWNPAWSISTILTGLLSFMTGDEATTGSIRTSEKMKIDLAANSKKWNITENPRFIKQFPDTVVQNQKDIDEAAKKKLENDEKEKLKAALSSVSTKNEKINYDDLDPEDRIRAKNAAAAAAIAKALKSSDNVNSSSINNGVVVVGFVLLAVLAAYARGFF